MAVSATLEEKQDVVIADGDYRFRVDVDWAKLPDGMWFDDVSAVAIDSKDNVIIFARHAVPVTIFDRNGNLLNSWGAGQFNRPHHVFVAPDDTLFLTDDHMHCVRRFDMEGNLLMTLGRPNEPSALLSGKPFNRPTAVAMSPKGEIYVSDGYQNCAVHKFSPDGELMLSWGQPGCRPGEFNIVHGIVCDDDGLVYVADRENHRIQVFDCDGKYLESWHDFHRPNGFYYRRLDGEKRFFVGEAAPALNATANWWGIGPWISVFDEKGKCLAKLGAGRPGHEPGAFISPHGLAVDSHGDIYVGECAKGGFKKYLKGEMPERLKCLQKLIRLD